jgi:hypothetical protein
MTTSISKLEGVDTSRTWSVDGVKIKIGKDDHALFQHEADAHDAIIAHNSVDDTLALVEAAKILIAIGSKDPTKIVDSAAWVTFRSATEKFIP